MPDDIRRRAAALATDYRFWARLPADVAAIVLLPEVPEYPIHPVAVRPAFPPGVCTGCGCTDDDPCLVDVDGIGPAWCAWTDDTHTRCTACAPRAT
jgi:hypothetical protein